MRYVVKGANKDTGEDVTLRIDAKNPSAAGRQASGLGVFVLSVTREWRKAPMEPKPRPLLSDNLGQLGQLAGIGIMLLSGLMLVGLVYQLIDPAADIIDGSLVRRPKLPLVTWIVAIATGLVGLVVAMLGSIARRSAVR
jgi:hypothetical protein